jgi:hypothetical protein
MSLQTTEVTGIISEDALSTKRTACYILEFFVFSIHEVTLLVTYSITNALETRLLNFHEEVQFPSLQAVEAVGLNLSVLKVQDFNRLIFLSEIHFDSFRFSTQFRQVFGLIYIALYRSACVYVCV